jgi:hypothetical protein
MRRIGTAILLASACPALPAAGQTAFISRLGNDTVAVERYSRRDDRIEGISVVRSPRTTVRRYELRLHADGLPASMRIEAGPPGGRMEETTEYTWRGDTLIGTFRQDTVRRRWTVTSAERALPFSETLYAPWEAALRLAAGRSTLALVNLRQLLRYTVERRADGSLALHLPGHDPAFDPVLARTDVSGGLTSLDLTQTTTRFLVTRVPDLDVEALAADFARRERTGSGLGALSPRDTVRATIGDAHVLVDYSRPSVRGRTVFGGLLAPFGQVWRTGADAATQLVTDRDLEIGGRSVPAGTYSLYSIPTPSGWILVVNRQHGQWGTEYHAERDLARIPLALRHTAPVERFTIRVSGGVLSLAWADRQGSVPLRAR